MRKSTTSKHRSPAPISKDFGVSFSVKACRAYNIDPDKVLKWLLDKGWRRFRLMSYWDEHEKSPGEVDLTQLDKHIRVIKNYGGEVTLCIGARQPRWPESHWPDWAWELPPDVRNSRLSKYIKTVMNRYKNEATIVSWQLENEALNRGFGERGNFDRKRLRSEMKLVKSIDPTRPVIMTTSNTWGVPLRRPRANLYGYTYYTVQMTDKGYKSTKLPKHWYKLRSIMIRMLTGRKSFIHELQAEPWGNKPVQNMTFSEQSESMDPERLKRNIELAKSTGLYPIDLWGAEWWYWRATAHNDPSIYTAVESSVR